MKLYHGTNVAFDKIDLSFAKPYKDFGQGFYLTTLEEQAVEMAKRACRIYGGDKNIVILYVLDDDVLRNPNLNIIKFDEPSIDWAFFVMNNRKRKFNDFDSPLWNGDNRYDIAIGPVANDTMALQFELFEKEAITAEQLVERIKYSEYTNQYSFHSEKAITYLKKVGEL